MARGLAFAALGLLLRPVLWWRSRPSLVHRALSEREYERSAESEGVVTRVGVVQLGGRLMAGAAEYAATAYRLVRQAVRGGAHLVVFPEDAGSYPLGGLIPGVKRFAERGSEGDELKQFESGAVPMAFLLGLLASVSRRIYRTTFSVLAERFGVHIVAGSGLEMDAEGMLLKCGCLFGPDGCLIGTQPKTHLYPAEATWGMGRGDRIEVFDTSVGRVSFPICMDHTFFEPIRVAWLRGAEIVIDPAADAAAYDAWAQSRGVWGRVQESPAYGIACFMVGEMLGVRFEGRSGVYAPLEMTEDGTGVVAQAESATREEVLFADLDLGRLREYRREHPRRFNLALYARYLPSVYDRYSDREIGGRRLVT